LHPRQPAKRIVDRSNLLRPLALENSNGFEQILAHRIGCQRARPPCPAERLIYNPRSMSRRGRNVNHGLTISTGILNWTLTRFLRGSPPHPNAVPPFVPPFLRLRLPSPALTAWPAAQTAPACARYTDGPSRHRASRRPSNSPGSASSAGERTNTVLITEGQLEILTSGASLEILPRSRSSWAGPKTKNSHQAQLHQLREFYRLDCYHQPSE